MAIDAKTIDKLADLSRLKFSPEAQQKMTADLENILGFISKLNEANTENVSPLTSVLTGDEEGSAAYARERKDEVTETPDRDANQSMAPSTDMGFYVVPQVIE